MRPHRVDDSVLGVRFSVDYSRAEIVTRLFSWSVTRFVRKDIFYLRRLLCRVPAKIATLYTNRNLATVSSLVKLLHNCVSTFQQRVLVVVVASYDDTRESLINLNGAAPFPISKQLTAVDAILTLCSKLIGLARTSTDDNSLFWRRAEYLACYADLVREQCDLYLKFVFPVLSARVIDSVYNETLTAATSLLSANRSCLRREMFRLRAFAHDWWTLD